VPSPPLVVDLTLAELVADAKQLQLAMLPRPRTLSPRVIDLTATEISIPAETASLLEGIDPYGT
jgi:hypothetical protein